MAIDMVKAAEVGEAVLASARKSVGDAADAALLQPALDILRKGGMEPETDDPGVYTVTTRAGTQPCLAAVNMCECAAWHGSAICKHVVAVRIVTELLNKHPSAILDDPQPEPGHAENPPNAGPQASGAARGGRRNQQQRQPTGNQRPPAAIVEAQKLRAALAVPMKEHPSVALIKSSIPSLQRILPARLPFARFEAGLAIHLRQRRDKVLHTCTPESVYDAVAEAAMTGYVLGRDAGIATFKHPDDALADQGIREAKLIPYYKGIVRVLIGSGQAAKAFAECVYENDEWKYDTFNPPPMHEPARKARGKEEFYFGAIQEKSGVWHVRITSIETLNKIERNAPGHERGAWKTNQHEMRLKSALKQAKRFVELDEGALPDALADELRDPADEAERIPTDRQLAEQVPEYIDNLFGEDNF